jgi:hypothetical protein
MTTVLPGDPIASKRDNSRKTVTDSIMEGIVVPPMILILVVV